MKTLLTLPCDWCGWMPWNCTCRGVRRAKPAPKIPRRSFRGIARSRR